MLGVSPGASHVCQGTLQVRLIPGGQGPSQTVGEQLLRKAGAESRIGRDDVREPVEPAEGQAVGVGCRRRQRDGDVDRRAVLVARAITADGVVLLERQAVWIEQRVAAGAARRPCDVSRGSGERSAAPKRRRPLYRLRAPARRAGAAADPSTAGCAAIQRPRREGDVRRSKDDTARKPARPKKPARRSTWYSTRSKTRSRSMSWASAIEIRERRRRRS